MEPLSAIAIAKGLADVSGLSDWLADKLGDTLGEKTARKISGIATAVTGAANPQEALERVRADQALAAELKKALVANEHELTLAALADVQNARALYSTKSEMADRIAEQVIKHNHIVVALLLLANGVVLYLVDDKAMALALGNLIGGSVTALWQERQQVIGFFFGSSLGSKLKTFNLTAKKDG